MSPSSRTCAKVPEYNRVWHVFGMAIIRQVGCSTCLDVVKTRPEKGGTRDSIYSAIVAPPIGGVNEWNKAATSRMRQAEHYLAIGAQRTRATQPVDLASTVQFPQWVARIVYAAERYSSSGRFETLVPDFYSIDPNHARYKHYKYSITEPGPTP